MSMSLGLVTTQKQAFVLHQSMALLRMSSQELTDFLLETAEVNPLLLVTRPRRRLRVRNSTTDALEAMAEEASASLFTHVTAELRGLLARGGLLARIVEALIEELEPSGWLGAPLSGIAGRFGIAEAHVASVLTLVQKRVEPAGLFARSLQECLRLQLEEQGEVGPDMLAVLAHLDLLERGNAGDIAKRTGVSHDHVLDCLAALRRLDPKPGARFAPPSAALMREPDAQVVRGPHGWEVRFQAASEPTVGIGALPRGLRSDEVAQALKQARALKQALDLRLSAMRKVVAELVVRQQAYFDHGAVALHPLAMADLARATGFHASTVGRVLNGYLIEGPHGVIGARDLCSGAASRGSGAHSRTQVMALLRGLLDSEDPAAPLSDARLVALLLAEGVTLSRRMAAKYRQLLGYAPAALRRRRA